MNGDGRDDMLGTWDGQGVFYRDSITGAWVKMASPATLITTGDVDGDATDDLIGIWPTQGGVWVKYSQSGTWAPLSSTAQDISAGKIRAAAVPAPPMLELPLLMGGNESGPEFSAAKRDLSSDGPGGWRFVYMEDLNLVPNEDHSIKLTRILSPGEPGFICAEQENLFPQESVKRDRDGKKSPQPKKKTIKR